MKKVLITGIAGQTASYLAEYLLSLGGFKVFGMIRRNSTPENQENRISHLEDRITTFYGDLTDPASIDMILKAVKPDYIFNLAAQSHVRISYDIPSYTVQANALGVLNLLESMRVNCPKARLLQASSSEMFGDSVDEDGYQRESTHMTPVSPYGCSKLFAYSLIRNYRIAYKLHLCNSICFNHESPRRGSNFVTNKVVKAAVRIKLGLQDKLELGNMDSYRDWGHAKDYVRAMLMIIIQQEPSDYVVSTGETRSVREMCDYVFSKLDLDYTNYVVQNPKFLRPQELPYLKGDSSRIRRKGWKPTYTFETRLDEMIGYWESVYKEKL